MDESCNIDRKAFLCDILSRLCAHMDIQRVLPEERERTSCQADTQDGGSLLFNR